MPYKEPTRRSVRLDDDVYEAVRAMPESLNRYLRRNLLESRLKSVAVADTRKRAPLLKPSQKRTAHTSS